MSQGISPLPKDNGPAADPVKVVSNKRLHTDAPSSPGYPNVYVRRKVETEHSKVNPSQELKGNGRDKTKEQEEQQNVQHNQANKPEVASPIVESGGLVPSELASPIAESGGLVPSESPEKISAETVPCFQRPETVSEKDKPLTTSGHGPPIDSGHEPPIASGNEPPIASGNEPPIASDNEPPSASGTTVQGDSQRSSSQNQYWNERYNRLQTYLENCDRSTQEGYMRMLRSMSAADRSMHAIELEKRAIHLLVEEGKELQLMKALNVLGKVYPNGPPKQAPLQRQYQK